MRAELRSVMSVEVSELSSWRPIADSWSLPLWMMCGVYGQSGEDEFIVTVCSVDWVRDRIKEDGLLSGRNLLIVEGFSWSRIHAYLEKYVSSCSGSSWKEIASKLARLGHWEYENYHHN